MIDALELLETGRDLISSTPNRTPTEGHIRRAISAAYYAVFHTLAKSNADLFAGVSQTAPTIDAWARVYRRLEHRRARNNLRSAHSKLSPDADRFINAFDSLQNQRHLADYDPITTLSLNSAITALDQAEDAINRFNRLTESDRRYLASFSLFDAR